MILSIVKRNKIKVTFGKQYCRGALGGAQIDCGLESSQ